MSIRPDLNSRDASLQFSSLWAQVNLALTFGSQGLSPTGLSSIFKMLPSLRLPAASPATFPLPEHG